MSRLTLALLALPTLAPAGHAQIFVRDDAALPPEPLSNASDTDGVSFADVDLDGDWDVALADGGDHGNDQNRLWLNLGGLQAGVEGTFSDVTDQRLPAINDSSRDVDFADLDGDGDPDLFVSNHSSVVAQSNRFLINQGGDQGGSLGFFADETAARYLGLGGPGSSVSPAFVLGSGGFIDWTSDADFADLDSDGDLDLVHTSYGSSYAGGVPTRLFLNDGSGRFSEFNPSGFSLASANIADGDPALWAEGIQADGTLDTTGQFADIATSLVHGELFDIDGDFDLDVLLGSRENSARFFRNRLAETGTLAFRDVSAAVFPGGVASGQGKYDQEVGDLDGDLDLDLYGLNYSTFDDRAFRNDGGIFTSVGELPSSSDDDEQADFLDFDNDGDLDVYVANFSGFDRLYWNTGGAGPFGLVLVNPVVSGLDAGNSTARDADVCDLDGDGDDDVIVANRDIGSLSNEFFRNTLDIADAWPPAIAGTEILGDAPAAPGVRPVRTAVIDNAPLYVTAWQPVWFEVFVDGIEIQLEPTTWSGGQVFRAELPANLVGPVQYNARSADEYENVGSGPLIAYSAAGSAGAAFGASTPSSVGAPSLRVLSVPFAGEVLWLGVDGVAPATSGIFALATTALATPIDLGDGLLVHVSGPFLSAFSSANEVGQDTWDGVVPPGVPAGAQVHAQYFAVDGAGAATFASSNGVTITFP